uniref:Uncharacterized protein n=1 Tax=Heterorhabditis bacteriophora TaxID=37862 RepID=A0A1I7X035_HETBA
MYRFALFLPSIDLILLLSHSLLHHNLLIYYIPIFCFTLSKCKIFENITIIFGGINTKSRLFLVVPSQEDYLVKIIPPPPVTRRNAFCSVIQNEGMKSPGDIIEFYIWKLLSLEQRKDAISFYIINNITSHLLLLFFSIFRS